MRALWLVTFAIVLPSAASVGYLLWSAFVADNRGGVSSTRLFELARSTLLLTLTVTTATVVIGFTTAWLTTRTDLAGRRIWSTLVTLPLVLPSYVGALALLAATGNDGLLSQIARRFGLEGLPVASGFWAAAVALTLWNYPFVHLLAVPALRALDPSIEDSARGLGASRLKSILTVVLPQLRRPLASSGLLVALYVISDFGAVSLLRYETFTLAIYTQFRGRLDPGPALFLSGVLVVGALVLVAAERRFRGFGHRPTATRPARKHQPIQLSLTGRVVSLGILVALVMMALVIPLATLVFWVVRGLQVGATVVSPGDPILLSAVRTLGVATAASIVTALAAIPLAVVTVRRSGRTSRVLESVTWAGYALPHLAVGLAFLILTLRFVPVMYQSLTVVIVAYLAMFMPQALTSTQTGLQQIGPNLEWASRGLGFSPLATFIRVTLPVMAPSVVAGAGLVFLTVMKELPATLLLRPTGFETLAIRVWSASSELFYAQASTAALLLVGVSAVPLFMFVIRDIHDR